MLVSIAGINHHYICTFSGNDSRGRIVYNFFDDHGKIITMSEGTCRTYLNLGAVIIKATDEEI